MTDPIGKTLVERLRSPQVPMTEALLQEAADEIERLRAEIVELRTLVELKDERIRLRELRIGDMESEICRLRAR